MSFVNTIFSADYVKNQRSRSIGRYLSNKVMAGDYEILLPLNSRCIFSDDFGYKMSCGDWVVRRSVFRNESIVTAENNGEVLFITDYFKIFIHNSGDEGEYKASPPAPPPVRKSSLWRVAFGFVCSCVLTTVIIFFL